MDSALWSSLLAEHWGQVIVSAQTATSASTLWYAKQQKGSPLETSNAATRLASVVMTTSSFPSVKSEDGTANKNGRADTSNQANVSTIRSSMELLSPGYLAEPLSGGADIADWMAELRLAVVREREVAGGAAQTRCSESEAFAQRPSFHVCLPFSALFQLKYEAHFHSHHPHNSASQGLPLSLQERRARQTLLQSIHQVLQTQEDLNALSSDSFQRQPRVLQLHTWAPTEEFDALCDLPHTRPLLLQGDQRNHQSGAKHLSLAAVCEVGSARVAYFARYAALKSLILAQLESSRRGKESKETSGAVLPVPTALLAHGSDLRAFRALGVPLVRDRSTFAAWKQQMLHVCGEGNSGTAAADIANAAPGGERRSSSSVAHRQAWRGCGEMIRQMTKREENIRQSFSQY